MRAPLLIDTLCSLIQSEVKSSAVVVGIPGGGKTSIIKQVAKKLNYQYLQRHLPTMPVEDLGVPMVDKPMLYYKLPDWFPAKGSKHDNDVPGILCFDDRNQAGNDLQKALANLVQERELHGVPLADNWFILSTGNRQEDRAGANRVLSHLADREYEFTLDTHHTDWTAWASENGVRPEVISFINFKTALLHDFDPQRTKNASPRGWAERVSPALDVVPKEAEREVFMGAVGEGPATEFTAFLKIARKLPNPDVVLMNPKTADVPNDPATLYALAGSIAQRASVGNFERVCQYAERMPPEFSVLMVSMALRRDKELHNTAALSNWVVKHHDVMF
jgi:MoxR-like ATPase